MRSIASRSSKNLTLKIEDKDNKNFAFYYANKKNQRKKFTISDKLYDKLMHLNSIR